MDHIMKKFFRIIFFLLLPVLCAGETRAAEYDPSDIHALYLSIDNIHNSKKIVELEALVHNTSANGIVIDFKDSNTPNLPYMKKLVERFHKAGAYTIARIVVFQDSIFAKKYPILAVKKKVTAKDGKISFVFWYSGRAVWKRYWVDPASKLAQQHNILIAKQAIDCGFDEIQFDYIRFPTDGDMDNIHFPVFNPGRETKKEVVQHLKAEVMDSFFRTLRSELKTYAPAVPIGIDLFGEVFVYGRERGIGQNLADVAKYFDVLSPMAYPSHYKCGEFKVKDPNAHPYLVYSVTLKNGLKFLTEQKVIIRPWIQAFTLRNIYACGPSVSYGPENIKQQIKAGKDLDINGFMLWNARSHFSPKIFE
ncbi:MAG: hypothetical protein HYT37_03430 [Candidatus Sungbacteria bacterium]|nr:hypothetical protein [Candidatus Sungbacteria bacterium]